MSEPPLGHLLDAGLPGEAGGRRAGGDAEYVLEAMTAQALRPQRRAPRRHFRVHRGDVKAVLARRGRVRARCFAASRSWNQSTPKSAGGRRIGVRESGGRLVPLPERVLARERSEIGMVFQRFNLFPHLTAWGTS